MKYLPLIWKNLLRRKTRTLFTVLSVAVAFVLFCVLGAVRAAFSGGVEAAGADRMLVTHKVSLVRLLPISYGDDIAAIEGVADISHQTWFGAIYQDVSNFFPQFAVDAESYLRIFPEIVLPPEQRAAWLANRAGAVVGRATADRFGWSVGDRVPLQGTIWRNQRNPGWEFDIEGIFDAGVAGYDTSTFYFHHDFLAEGNTVLRGLVGLYVLRIADPAGAAAVGEAVDARFANASEATRTSPEREFLSAFANQVGNIAAIVTAVLTAVFFTIVVVATQTMAQAVRERTAEFAVLKTLGFTNARVLALVLAESVLLVAAGAALGLGAGQRLVALGDPTGGFLPLFALPAGTLATGAGMAVLIGLAAGALPCLAATRLRIVDALRQV